MYLRYFMSLVRAWVNGSLDIVRSERNELFLSSHDHDLVLLGIVQRLFWKILSVLLHNNSLENDQYFSQESSKKYREYVWINLLYFVFFGGIKYGIYVDEIGENEDKHFMSVLHQDKRYRWIHVFLSEEVDQKYNMICSMIVVDLSGHKCIQSFVYDQVWSLYTGVSA